MKPEEFGQEYFENSYKSYQKQNPIWKLESYLQLVEKYVSPSLEKRFLDVGCAFGSFLNLAKKDFSCFGTDISEYAISMAKKEVKGVNFQSKKAEEFEFKEKMDVIVSFDCLEHVSDLEKAFINMKKHSKKDTVLFFVTPVYDGLFGRAVSILDKDETHLHKKSRYWWIERINRHFKIVEWTGIFRYLLFGRYYINNINTLTKAFSPAILVVARNE